jgi:hypothetical protein
MRTTRIGSASASCLARDLLPRASLSFDSISPQLGKPLNLTGASPHPLSMRQVLFRLEALGEDVGLRPPHELLSALASAGDRP